MSTTAFTPPRFFVQMHIFSVSPSSFRVSSSCSNKQHLPSLKISALSFCFHHPVYIASLYFQ